ncbi:MAG: ParA family protein [Pleurocapsa sp. MO_226.B13]|nr:ParA family protein [Pleurocapsa sp. MO_226.B13]
MIVTLASFKGGVGKTTSAIHLATYIQEKRGSVLVVDGDDNRSCLAWAENNLLPFKVVDAKAAPKYYRQYDNIIIDTAARPEKDELATLAEGCDLLIIPCTPDSLSIKALSLTVKALKEIGSAKYRILLTIVPPKPTRDGEETREMLTEAGLSLFKQDIRAAIAFKRAALLGQPVYEVKDKRAKQVWKDYVSVGEEILRDYK